MHIFQRSFFLFILFIIYYYPFPVFSVQATNFNPNYIISDHELTDYQTMNLTSVQKFLESKSGILAYFKASDLSGQIKSSGEIIFEASQKYKINPQIILVLLQKEQSLIENPAPTEDNLNWATGFGLCESCNKKDPKISQFRGFVKQIDKAAEIFRWYLEEYEKKSSLWLHQVGQTYQIDNQKITPLNYATACLYNYTPHWRGNFNFWQIWNKWFAKIYPEGTLLQVKREPGIWLIQGGKRRPFLNKAAFLSSYDPKKVLQVERIDLERYESGLPIKHPQYALLRSPGGTVYLLIDGQRRGIISREVFRTIGFNPEEIIDLDWQELVFYPEVEPITLKSVFPAGALLQDKTTGGVWYVKNGIKRAIIDYTILKINFSKHSIAIVDPEELKRYPTQEPIKIKDGELVSSSQVPTIYIISNGEKLPINSPSTFVKLGYKWENVTLVPEKVLQLHPTGLPVSVIR